jgi:ribosome biogenesis GTPase
VVGDRVALVGDVSGTTDTLARIVRVEPRTSTLRRTADDTDPFERVIVANADQLVIVTALADPEPRPRMIDRCLVAAFDAGLRPLLCLTKSDLAPASSLLDCLRAARRRPRGDQPRGAAGRAAGAPPRPGQRPGRHSGVGKSTMVNALVPGAARAIGVVNAVTGRGRHTSSSAVALELPDGGWVIDTPGCAASGSRTSTSTG